MKMKKSVLIYFTWQLRPAHHSIVIQELDKTLERDDVGKVYFITCGGSLKPCYTNREGNPSTCILCKFHKNTALDKYKNRINHIELNDKNLNLGKYTEEYTYNSVDEIKKIKYKDCFIGYGALSSYISFTRNLEPQMDMQFRSYFDKMLNNQKALGDYFKDFIQSNEIEEVLFFNGRTSNVRPLYDISKALKIEFHSLELIKSSDLDYRVNKFKNSLPHDIEFHDQRMSETWNDSSTTLDEKIEIGSSFFENRRKGILTRDRKVYTNNQRSGELPNKWNNEIDNIVIFSSSEDEFASIGDIFESKALFPSQEKGLKEIFDNFNDDETVHFYLRVHPNLNEVNYQYHKRLYDFEKNYRNVTVISSSSTVNSYTLMDAADKVIVFGSSTGVEACYWGKPVILLGGSFYYYLDVAYKPSTVDEIYGLIKNELTPKPKIDAIQYGYYLMNYKEYTLPNSQDPQSLNILGFNLGLGFDFLKSHNSKTIFKIKEKGLKRILNYKKEKLYPLPLKEKLK
jgi:hypothetical protein